MGSRTNKYKFNRQNKNIEKEKKKYQYVSNFGWFGSKRGKCCI